MTLITHGIVDCRGFQIVKSLPWDFQGSETDDHEDGGQASKGSNWGVMICRSPDSMSSGNESDMDRLYGAVGPIQTDGVQEVCLGIPLHSASDPQSAVSHFALACGLSIIDRARLELGDTIVVAGANLLALNVLVAAKRQGARTACLVPDSESEAAYRRDMAQLANEIIQFEDSSSFDAKLDALIASSIGKTVFVDAVGQPSLVYAMAAWLERFGTLVLGRQGVATSVVVNIADVHHRKSAKFIYWTRPENLEEALILSECCRRAANLFQWKRVSMFAGVVSAGLDASSARERN